MASSDSPAPPAPSATPGSPGAPGSTDARAPLIDLALAPARVDLEHGPDGRVVLRSPTPLEPHPRCLGELLRTWAERAPARTFLAERDPAGDWRRLSYADALTQVRALAQAVLDRGLDRERPVMLLSGNGIDHALLALAAMDVGVPAAPISPAYSLLSQDHAKLRYIFELLTPGLIYAADGAAFTPALAALATTAPADQPPPIIAVSRNPPPGAVTVADLAGTAPGPAADAAFAALGPDHVAKILFTSGSTGQPKGVINTQRMLCANQQAIAQLWPFLDARPPVVVDWLPWSHTFGGNHNFNMVLWHGGSLYIDAGKPRPGLFAPSLDNLREVSPTLYFNVPAGFAMLVPALEADADLRARFFAELDGIFYAGAALPPHLWDQLEALSARARGRRVYMLSAWGSTETAPMATSVHFPIDHAGVIGLPAPGTDIALIPTSADDRHELRVRGPNVTPGYWRQDHLTAAAFDDQGYFRMGDAGRLADPNDPSRGIVFAGRTAESFKLTSGTWVHVGELRLAVIAAAAPLIQDAVVTGHDRDQVGLLVFPNLAACRELIGVGADDPAGAAEAVVHSALVHDRLAAALSAYNRDNAGSSRRVARALLMAEPAGIDAGEITDKGYINQRAVLERRADLVERLYGPGGPDVVEL
ncbi:feruloyl-CoA synthase [Haliangium sp.]|uniref:feruloyl-CoA synthase n=1 Tax=Haliangium sp. TaxID=2663208 RepID=UPI003D0C0F1A